VQPGSALQLRCRGHRVSTTVTNATPTGLDVLDREIGDIPGADLISATGGSPGHLLAGLFGIMDHPRGEGRGISDYFLGILATDEVDGVRDGGLEAGNDFCT
jgi:hypothetical protein